MEYTYIFSQAKSTIIEINTGMLRKTQKIKKTTFKTAFEIATFK